MGVSPSCLLPPAALDLGNDLGHLRRRDLLAAERADGAVTAPDAEHDAARMELRQRRRGAGAHGVVACRIRDGHAYLDALGLRERVRHVDPDVLPQHLGVDEPGAVVARRFGRLHRLDEDGEVFGRK